MAHYRLPPAWDPGFAMPKNALDEGLQRRAFVTKWTPRGTYDDPAVNTKNPGGFAIPKYVQQEQYGQGARVTSWQPSGTYNGPKIPHFLNQRPTVVDAGSAPGGGQYVKIARPTAVKPPRALSGVDVNSMLPYAAAAGVAYLLLRKKRKK